MLLSRPCGDMKDMNDMDAFAMSLLDDVSLSDRERSGVVALVDALDLEGCRAMLRRKLETRGVIPCAASANVGTDFAAEAPTGKQKAKKARTKQRPKRKVVLARKKEKQCASEECSVCGHCGARFPRETSKFCGQCGTRRV